MKKNTLVALVALALLLPASPGFASSDAPAAAQTVAPVAAAQAQVKRGTDWRFLAAVPLLWPIGAAIWASGWQPAVLPADPAPVVSGDAAAPAVVAEKIDHWGSE